MDPVVNAELGVAARDGAQQAVEDLVVLYPIRRPGTGVPLTF